MFLYVLPFVLFEESSYSVDAYVRQENNFIVLKTRDAGTFIGITEPSPTNATEKLEIVPEDAGQGRTYYAFRGVPYAKPPVGPLRWKVRDMSILSFQQI